LNWTRQRTGSQCNCNRHGVTMLAGAQLENQASRRRITCLFWRGEYQCPMPLTDLEYYNIWLEMWQRYTRQNFITPKNWISVCLICDMAWSISFRSSVARHRSRATNECRKRPCACIHV